MGIFKSGPALMGIMQIQSCFLSPGCTFGSSRSEHEPPLSVILLCQHGEVKVRLQDWALVPSYKHLSPHPIIAHKCWLLIHGGEELGRKTQHWDIASALSQFTTKVEATLSDLQGEDDALST